MYGAKPAKARLPTIVCWRGVWWSAESGSSNFFTKPGTITAMSPRHQGAMWPDRQTGAALIKDLKQRGLLKDTLVIWGGEFGRTPMVETNKEAGRNMGRDHHPKLQHVAGRRRRSGRTDHRQDDDFGFNSVEDRVPVHDLHATILHLLGFDHTKLTYHFQGRDFRLTDVEGEVVKKLLADCTVCQKE